MQITRKLNGQKNTVHAHWHVTRKIQFLCQMAHPSSNVKLSNPQNRWIGQIVVICHYLVLFHWSWPRKIICNSSLENGRSCSKHLKIALHSNKFHDLKVLFNIPDFNGYTWTVTQIIRVLWFSIRKVINRDLLGSLGFFKTIRLH